jgi:hypothetical protein
VAYFWNSPSGGSVHLVQQDPVDVPGQQLVPLRTPDHLDHVPARAPEGGLGLLDDLPVPPDGTVESLEVAVHDEDQIVEVLPTGHREGTRRVHFVELTVTDETPDPRGRRIGDLPVEEIAVHMGLVDGGQRTETHRDGRVLPEVGKEPGMGIGGESPTADFLPEVVELVLGEPPLDEGPGVDPRGGVALEEDHVPEAPVGLPPEEVVEADLVERGRGGVGGQVAPDPFGPLVGPGHHDRRVPPDVGPDPPLQVFVAREPGLLVPGDRVHVGSRDRRREVDLYRPGPLQQLHQEKAGPGPALGVDHRVEGVDPFRRLLRIDVRELVGHSVEEHRPQPKAHLRGPRSI